MRKADETDQLFRRDGVDRRHDAPRFEEDRARFFSCRLMGRSLPHAQIITPIGRFLSMDFRSAASAVLMAMVKVGVVHMPVPEPFMAVPVGMRLCDRRSVRVLVMLVVDMPVFVLEPCVRMLMAVPFG